MLILRKWVIYNSNLLGLDTIVYYSKLGQPRPSGTKRSSSPRSKLMLNYFFGYMCSGSSAEIVIWNHNCIHVYSGITCSLSSLPWRILSLEKQFGHYIRNLKQLNFTTPCLYLRTCSIFSPYSLFSTSNLFHPTSRVGIRNQPLGNHSAPFISLGSEPEFRLGQ